MVSCSACSLENPAGARFCMGCGAALQRSCSSCGELALEGARFCMACGAQLDAVSAAIQPAAKQRPAASADEPSVALASPTLDERRTVTVLFADLSGYTAVAERLDPESVKRQLERILGRLGEEVVGLRGLRRQVHRRQRDGDLRRSGRARRRRRARGARRPGDAGGDGRAQRAAGRAARRHVRAVRGHQHGRGARRSRRATATR